ncbi:conserved hypothetical protein [Frankia canadensis]|uniref:DUF1232 domain-containing protein n=1 Tax=Frankia canadensis TaxID=1836972 RepID=A0A2I2L0B8_9ACTN|nr:DUF1232 domain-containing protein [Frankia canadensis]SNQ51317.1 conserved hypothetical protein [Frankia canadensis]SOU58607.1 conserved hypothetical protein [Frankia canadensis]
MGDVGTGLLIGLGVVVAVGVVLAGVAFVVFRRHEVPLRGAAAAIGSILYLLSPVDAVPEVPLGPIGLVDDLMVLFAAAAYVRRLIQARREPVPGELGRSGLLPPAAPPRLPRQARQPRQALQPRSSRLPLRRRVR